MGVGLLHAERRPPPVGKRRRTIYLPAPAAATGRQKDTVLDGPVDSIRWEMLRDGIEDYEYFAILRRMLAEGGGKLSAPDRAAYRALLTVPKSVTSDRTTFTKTPAPIEARRHEIAKAIEKLSKKK